MSASQTPARRRSAQLPRRGGAARLGRSSSAGTRSKSRAIAGIEIVESIDRCARTRSLLLALVADPVRDRHARALPAPARRSPRRDEAPGGRGDRPHRRAGRRLRRARRARAGARAAAADRRPATRSRPPRAVSASTGPTAVALSRPTTASARWASSSRTRRSCSTTRLVLKVFRKLEPGVNPELEMLRFLTWRGFPNIAPLHGWYDYEGQAFAATLGVAPALPPRRGRRLGARARGDRSAAPTTFLERARRASARSPPSSTTRSPPTPATRPSRPRSQARKRCRCSPRRSTRTSSGSSCAYPTMTSVWRRSSAAARTCASASPPAPRSASPAG